MLLAWGKKSKSKIPSIVSIEFISFLHHCKVEKSPSWELSAFQTEAWPQADLVGEFSERKSHISLNLLRQKSWALIVKTSVTHRLQDALEEPKSPGLSGSNNPRTIL